MKLIMYFSPVLCCSFCLWSEYFHQVLCS